MQTLSSKTIIMNTCIVAVAILLCVVSYNMFAHSEAEKARFVSADGNDAGDCNNRFRPCKTIGYASQRANKGDKILVAQGDYELSSSEELVYLLSDMQPVLGGYNKLDNYIAQAPDQFITTLSGVPRIYADALFQKGFKVIVDTKGSFLNSQVNSNTGTAFGLAAVKRMQSKQSASDCINGSSSGFACNGISLLGHLPLSDLPTASLAANDIWGHVDLNDMREYAIIGLQRGIAVVDVSEPSNPIVVGSVSGQRTTWRDIKVLQFYNEQESRFNAYAYSGGDNISEGVSVIELSNLPSSIRLVDRSLIDLQSHNIYISNVDYTTNTALAGQTPILHTTGSNNFGGAWRSYDLSDPEQISPAYQNNTASRADYTHDASSLMINDERASRDCGLDQGVACNLMLDFNENEVRFWQHSDINDAVQLSQASYPNLSYVHSGWWTEDKQHVIVHDELDERDFGLNTTLNIFNINDLNNPVLASTWTGPTRAIDHNGFVRGNKYYMSNYERGLTILDIGDATSPQEIGFFDTFGPSDNTSFNGAWGVYPYLPSGIVLLSDIQGGLYILKDETLQANDNAVGFAQTIITGQEGETLQVEVNKQGTQSLSVNYEIIYPSATNADVTAANGTFTWPANDTQSQFIEIEINNDTLNEATELIAIKLTNATNGDIINAKSHAFINIQGTRVDSGVVEFAQAQLAALENQMMLSVNVERLNGSEQALSIDYSIASGSAILGSDFESAGDTLLSGTIMWADDDDESKIILLNIIDDDEFETDETFTIQLSSDNPDAIGANNRLTVTIKDDESNQAPMVSAGANRQINTRQSVTINDASVSDDGEGVVLEWQQSEGPNVELIGANSLNVSFVAPSTPSVVVLSLIATDAFGIQSTASAEFTVLAAPESNINSGAGSGGGSLHLIYLLLVFLIVATRSICFSKRRFA